MSEQKLRNHSTHKKMTKIYAGKCTAVLDSTPPNAGKKKENILKIRIYKVEEEESKMRKRRRNKRRNTFSLPQL